MKDYILKIVCPSCSKKIGVGWKFCAFCGEYVDNSKPKVELRYLDDSRSDNNQKGKILILKCHQALSRLAKK